MKTRSHKRRLIGLLALCLLGSSLANPIRASAVHDTTAQKQPAATLSSEEIFRLRRELYENFSALTGVPWHRLAAIDQYERTLTKANPSKRPQPAGLVAIYIPARSWGGATNPDPEDTSPASIALFHGIGRDGNGDGIADAKEDADILYTVAQHFTKYGPGSADFAIGLWDYYQNGRAVQRIQQFARLYEKHDRLDLFTRAFPLPVGTHYSYRSTWGSGRSWGGKRMHEGTDLFANYGLPVRSTCYGVVEIKGWNRFGGWRIGIRDLDNLYHYYAHLSGYDKKLRPGDLVEPGQVIGWVGSSGYGKPGTQGKFPPHLHYGIYRDRGLVEWAFDPYALLRQWEKDDRSKRKPAK